MSAVKERDPVRMVERERQNDQAKYARLRRAEQAWEERQIVAVRGQQAAMRAAFYERHPEFRP